MNFSVFVTVLLVCRTLAGFSFNTSDPTNDKRNYSIKQSHPTIVIIFTLGMTAAGMTRYDSIKAQLIFSKIRTIKTTKDGMFYRCIYFAMRYIVLWLTSLWIYNGQVNQHFVFSFSIQNFIAQNKSTYAYLFQLHFQHKLVNAIDTTWYMHRVFIYITQLLETKTDK